MATFYLLVGPSGVGKSKLLERLVSDTELGTIVRSISVTTRKPRGEERNGIDYFFVDKDAFLDMVTKEQLLEYNEYGGRYYGTPRQFIDTNLADNKDVVGIIEVKGAKDVMRCYAQDGKRELVTSIFIYPEKFNDLFTRLTDRDVTAAATPEQKREVQKNILKRLAIAVKEVDLINDFDYRICMRHDLFDEAYSQLRSIIVAERARQQVNPEYRKQFVQDWAAVEKAYKV
ncbi:50S ribosome-binding GTPase [Candidatus Woesearchaeota archaeon]|nr:50S ribosome-binding GTPase [Candidatus Woesearchaeota archaeon]